MPAPQTNHLAISLHLSSLLAQLLFLSSPKFPPRRALAVSVILSLAISSHLAGPTSQIAGDAQPFALLWPIYLGTLDKFLTAENGIPENSFWRVDRPVREATSMPPFSFQKLKWAAAVMFNTRGVRWNFEVAKLPHAESPSGRRRPFLVHQTLVFLKTLLITDLLLQLSERLFWTSPTGSAWADSKHLSITHVDWRWSFVKTLVFGCGPYFFVKLQYVAASIVAVALGFSAPEDWPPYFGHIGQVTTVRHFWGSFWHQTLRRTLTSINHFTANLLNIPRGTTLSSYSQIWIAFTVSGFMHAISMLLLPYPANITLQERTWGVMKFFVWQAAVITLEDILQWAWNKMAGPRASRQSTRIKTWAGYAWVVTSFWISLPWAADVMMRIRLTEKSFLVFSVVGDSVRQYVPIPP